MKVYSKIPGVRSRKRIIKKGAKKISLFLFIVFTLIVLNTVIPVALDSFEAIEEGNIEDSWGIGDILSLEITLLVILTTFSQVPICYLIRSLSENIISEICDDWKNVTFFLLVAAGFLTPTIDAATQLSFAANTFSLVAVVILILQKRLRQKLPDMASFI